MILLDTHALLWLAQGRPELGKEARRLSDEALEEDRLAVSAISFWEVAMLQEKRRIELFQQASAWRESILRLGLVEIAVTGEIGIAAVALPDFHGDPADRIIVATASIHGAALITADKPILEWTGSLHRHDARR